jgi:hydroxymethylpyrimidine pyrophosphatase-like HAD family hydrolase
MYENELPVLPVDFVIFSTGAGIMRHPGGELLKSQALPRIDIERIIGKLETLGIDYMVHWPIPETKRFMYRLRHENNADFHRRMDIYHQWGEPLPKILPVELTEATEILCIVPEESGHDWAARIADMLPAHSVIKATSPLDGRSIWVEIFPPEVAKSHAVAWLASRLGLSRDQVGAVGNDYNDLDMLAWVQDGFVVANSPRELQRDFRAVASNNEAGVAEAIVAWRRRRRT